MQYHCTLKSLSTFVGDPKKFITLCDKCQTYDCENPIEFVSISILGVASKHRIYKNSTGGYQVVRCDGFSSDTYREDDEA